MSDTCLDAARAVLERLEEEGQAPEILRALRDLIDERYPRRQGRQKGHDLHDDDQRLARLEELLRSGADEAAAIQRVAAEDPGDNEKNTRRRLRRKLPRVHEMLEDPRRAEREEIIRKAFAETVEMWDL